MIEPVSGFSLAQWLINVTRTWRYWFAGLIAPAFTIPYTPRPMIEYMKEKGMFNLVGVEIGVYKAKNAKSIMEMIKPAKLFLVDPYETYIQNGQICNAERYYSEAKHRMRRYAEKVTFIKKLSSDAVKDLPMLDFVYVDGNHEYKFVKEDLKLYYEKLRVGGVIGGHDFNSMNMGLCRAAVEFAKWHNLEMHGNRNDFWFVKGS